MELLMCGLDHVLAPVALRERLSFPPARAVQVMEAVHRTPEVMGCILLSTCNRTELYLTVSDQAAVSPARLLCRAAGEEYAPFAAALVSRRGRDCARHLMEVAAGLRSQIWGEDQIVSQVKRAMELAQGAGLGGAVLDTLFREAAAAGKEVRASLRFTPVPGSVALRAVERAGQALGGLKGRRAVVIGNGEMGRLSARLLREAGCSVTVTLRSYRHGETVVPAGCAVVAYDQRVEAMEGADLVLSATTSPHYTLSREQVEGMSCPPSLFLDLSIPRDLDPALAELDGAICLNVDSLGGVTPQEGDRKTLEQAQAIVERHLEQFYQWWSYRDCLPLLKELKEAVSRRVLAAPELEGLDQEETVRLAVARTVELMAGGMKGAVNPEMVRACTRKVKARTRG